LAIPHEPQCLLAPIRNAGEVLSRTGPEMLAAQAAIDIVQRQVANLTRLVDDLSTLAHARSSQRRSVQLMILLRQSRSSTSSMPAA
jgi:signal transduction histidine kinase